MAASEPPTKRLCTASGPSAADLVALWMTSTLPSQPGPRDVNGRSLIDQDCKTLESMLPLLDQGVKTKVRRWCVDARDVSMASWNSQFNCHPGCTCSECIYNRHVDQTIFDPTNYGFHDDEPPASLDFDDDI